MNNIKLIVGLANPGLKYIKTRHNIGSLYVNLLADSFNVKLKQEKKFFGFTSCINVCDKKVFLLVPTTFVNLSGISVISLANFYSININEILIAHDELDLLPGIIKLKFGGSLAGHNGLKSIKSNFNNSVNFYRLRIGIGRPIDKNNIVNFVLNNPTKYENDLIKIVMKKVIDYTKIFLSNELVNCSRIFKAL
ncbi:aminoacyl-tRNA hydrolase [Candidatus Providencia siddallii]|uniref:Peptidyl-tRNA hydrolase n=1 Tax=Candidatus Providencia siddallii TaxID=1715285 RepID=A0ABM9NPW9_9GAMM